MRILRQSTIADALAGWGAHEAEGRLRGQHSAIKPDKLSALNVVLHFRAPFVARVLMREPITTFEVELEPGDAEAVVLADARNLASWIETTRARGGDSLTYFESVVGSVDPPMGPFFAAV